MDGVLGLIALEGNDERRGDNSCHGRESPMLDLEPEAAEGCGG